MPLTWRHLTVPVLLSSLACSGTTRSAVRGPAPSGDCCLEVGRRVAVNYRVAAISTRRFTHAELWTALDPSLRRRTA